VTQHGNKADSKISEDTPKAVSRRNFIKGVITSGVAISPASYLFRVSSLLQGQQLAAGIRERLLTLNVNGQQRRVDIMQQETLAWTLRYKLGLTGTKLGCDRAECGSRLSTCSLFATTVHTTQWEGHGFSRAAPGQQKCGL
jgi:hypothetical protein